MPFDSKTWYLGWLGDMRAFPITPETNFQMTEERFGGVHQSLSGARTIDSTGFRQTFDFDFKYLTDAEYEFLRACYLGHISESLFLRNPMRKNLLSEQSSKAYVTNADDLGIYIGSFGNTVDSVRDFPSGITTPGTQVPRVISISSGPQYYTLDGLRGFIPVNVTEPVTFSIYLRTTSGSASASVYMDALDKYGVAIPGAGASVAASVTTSWQRFSVTVTPVAGVACVRSSASLTTPGTYNLCMAAPQVEYGNVATAFSIGGGWQKVVIDQIKSESPRYPLQNVSVTILEA